MPDDWMTYEGVVISRYAGGAYAYRTGRVSLDADGSPRAYHPDDTGIDANANAGYPHRGWRSVLAVDPADPDRPYVQPDGPFAGYFVSKTSLRSHDAAIPIRGPTWTLSGSPTSFSRERSTRSRGPGGMAI